MRSAPARARSTMFICCDIWLMLFENERESCRKAGVSMTEQTKNFEKAAALFWALGGSIPHDSELETEAEKEVREAGSREAVLRRAIRLCGGGNTPGERYLLAHLGQGLKSLEFLKSVISE